MKKVLLIGLVLAICILAFPQGVMAAPQDVPIDATIEDSVSFSVTPPGPWTLYYGTSSPTNPLPLSFDVVANSPYTGWDITVADMGEETHGHMAPFSGGYYDLTMPVLTNPIGVGVVTDLTDTAQTLHSASGSMTFSEDLTQVLTSSDSSIPSYRIVLTFDIVPY